MEIAREYHKDKKQDTHFAGSDITAAPEQYGYGQTDERTDIFALGRVFCYMLTGEYDVKQLATLEYPGQLVRIITKCAAFDSNNRYASVKEVKESCLSSRK